MAKRSPTQIALRYQVLLEGLKTGEAKRFAGIVDKIGDTFLAWTTQLEAGNLTRSNRLKFERGLSRLQKAVKKSIEGDGAELLERAEEIGFGGADFELRSLATTVAGTQVAQPTAAAVRSAVFQRGLGVNGAKLSDYVTGWVNAQPARVADLARKAYARGMTVQELTQAYMGDKKLRGRNGMKFRTRREAETVARTMVQHAASAARESVWEENKDIVTGFKFVATLDGRTSPICRALDGKKFNVGKGPIPPLHFNCRSVTVPIVDPELGLDFLDEGATRSSKDGYVSADTDFYDWLKGQDADYQDTVLGKTRGQLFREGGLTKDQFVALNMDKDLGQRTLAEMRVLAPKAFQEAGIDGAVRRASASYVPPTDSGPAASFISTANEILRTTGAIPNLNDVARSLQDAGKEFNLAAAQAAMKTWTKQVRKDGFPTFVDEYVRRFGFHPETDNIQNALSQGWTIKDGRRVEALAAAQQNVPARTAQRPSPAQRPPSAPDPAQTRVPEPVASGYAVAVRERLNETRSLMTNERARKLGIPLSEFNRERERHVGEQWATFALPQDVRATPPFVGKGFSKLPEVQKATEFLTNHIHPDAYAGQKLKVSVGTGSMREYYDPRTKEIAITDQTYAKHVIHEFGHHIETSNPAAVRAQEEFLRRRTKGEKPASLEQLDPFTYRGMKGETAYADDFVKRGSSVYAGKVYEKNGKVTNMEVLTMGLERMYTDPKLFAEQDPEYFDLVVDIMSGRIK